MTSLLRRFGSSGGNAIVEFALLSPLLLTMTAGVVEFGRIFVTYPIFANFMAKSSNST